MATDLMLMLAAGALALLYVVSKIIESRRAKTTDAAVVVVTGGDGGDGVEMGRIGLDTSSPMKQTTAMRRRRASPIAAYVGLNGSAKTATCIRDTLPDLAAGRQVLSTVALLAAEPAETVEAADAVWAALGAAVGSTELPRPTDALLLPHPLWIPFVRWPQLTTFKQGVVIMDEVQGLADSRESQSMPVQVSNKLFQLRRDGVILRWTTIDYTAADKRLRRATQTVTLCRGFIRRWVPGKIWPAYRFFWIRTYDGRGFDDFTSNMNRTNTKNRPRALVREWSTLRGRLSEAIRAYDSEAAVLALGDHVGGMCMTCNGKRSVPRCSCADGGGQTGRTGRGTTRTTARREGSEQTEAGPDPQPDAAERGGGGVGEAADCDGLHDATAAAAGLDTTAPTGRHRRLTVAAG